MKKKMVKHYTLLGCNNEQTQYNSTIYLMDVHPTSMISIIKKYNFFCLNKFWTSHAFLCPSVFFLLVTKSNYIKTIIENEFYIYIYI